jgi:hypothetical protein
LPRQAFQGPSEYHIARIDEASGAAVIDPHGNESGLWQTDASAA